MANISKIKVGNTSYGITATPTAHASTATTYGAASASNYGHVKLSDNYTSSAGTAASGIGASSAAVYNAYNTLNSNLAETTVSIWTSVATNPSGIVCIKKNNRIVLNGYLAYPVDVSPNEIITVGNVGDIARPTRGTTILVGVLGNDAETQGFTIGEVNSSGEINVKNSLSINARHFYFDAVWDV